MPWQKFKLNAMADLQVIRLAKQNALYCELKKTRAWRRDLHLQGRGDASTTHWSVVGAVPSPEPLPTTAAFKTTREEAMEPRDGQSRIRAITVAPLLLHCHHRERRNHRQQAGDGRACVGVERRRPSHGWPP